MYILLIFAIEWYLNALNRNVSAFNWELVEFENVIYESLKKIMNTIYESVKT